MSNTKNSYIALLEHCCFEDSIFIAEKNGFSIYYIFDFNDTEKHSPNGDFSVFIYPTNNKTYLNHVFFIGKSDKDFFGHIRNSNITTSFHIMEKQALYNNKKSNFSTIKQAIMLQKEFYKSLPYEKKDFEQKFSTNTNLLKDINKKNINQYLSLANNVNLNDFYKVISIVNENKSSLNILSQEEKDLFQLNYDIKLNFPIKEYVNLNELNEKKSIMKLIKSKLLGK